jgi:hypothetical protein
VQDVKKFLDAFLDSENPGVIAIKGDWGAGKTYFVTHYLQERPAIANAKLFFHDQKLFDRALDVFTRVECRNLRVINKCHLLLKKRDPKDIIYAMITNSGWSPEDTAALNEYSVDEYVKWLREEDDERLLHMLKNFVQTFNPNQSNPEWKSIGEKVFAAFRVLCSGNSFVRHKLINNVRVPLELLEEPVVNPPESKGN